MYRAESEVRVGVIEAVNFLCIHGPLRVSWPCSVSCHGLFSALVLELVVYSVNGNVER